MVQKELVLAGGGHAHLSVIKYWMMNQRSDWRVTLISDELKAPYSGMLPGWIAGLYTDDEIFFDLVQLCSVASIRLIHDTVIGLDPSQQVVKLKEGPPLSYDVLSLNVGGVPKLPDGFSQGSQVQTTKPIRHFQDSLQDFLRRLDPGQVARIAQVGGGAAGIEVLLGIGRQVRRRQAKFYGYLIEKQSHLLPSHNRRVQKNLAGHLQQEAVQLHLGETVTSVDGNELRLTSGAKINADFVSVSTGVQAPEWLRESALSLHRGYIAINSCLQSLDFENIFAAGDCAIMPEQPLPRAGVFAVRQGPILARNLFRFLEQKRLRRYRPQKRFLSLLTVGEKKAVVSYGCLATKPHPWVWQWKDRIDRRFMAKFGSDKFQQISSSMSQEMEEPMYCGGCGSKVAAHILESGLGDRDPLRRDDMAFLPFGDHVLAQTIDFLPEFLSNPYLMAQIAAEHALSDAFACGLKPDSALAMVVLPRAAGRISQSDLAQVTAGFERVLAKHGAQLKGGHTVEGEKFSLGLVVNSWMEQQPALLKQGSLVGDSLILTKPLGIGTYLRALGHGSLRAKEWGEVCSVMLKSNAIALELAKRFDIHAMTDITGFGLLGHLQEMIAEGQEVELFLDAVPMLAEATRLIKDFPSTMASPNKLSMRGRVHLKADGSYSPRYELLFDPQTSGGLMFSVSSNQNEDVLAFLHSNGFEDAQVVAQFKNAQSSPGGSIVIV